MTSRDTGRPDRPGRFGRAEVVLYALALLLACGCVVGGVLAWREHQDRSDTAVAEDLRPPSVEEQSRYREVRDAAEKMALALLNIDYEKPDESLEAVQAASTGSFLEEYSNVTDSVRQLVTQYQAVLQSEVVVSAVSTLEDDRATVLVATEGTVTNTQTGADAPQVRNFRVLVTVEQQDDAWLASNLEFVG